MNMDKYLAVEWLDYMVGVCLTVELLNCLSDFAILHIYQQYIRVLLAPHPSQHTVWSVVLILATLAGA